MMRVYGVDGDFVESTGLQMSQGRALTDEATDAQAIVINETAVRMLGWTEPLGKTINLPKRSPESARRGRDRGLPFRRSAPER